MVPVVIVPEVKVLETGVMHRGFNQRNEPIDKIRQAEVGRKTA